MSQQWIYTIVYLAWLAGAACFVLGLHRMNSPATGRSGNQLSAAGMVIAVGATFIYLLTREGGLSATAIVIIVVGFLIGGGAGLYTARTVKMTAMPQLVSLFNPRPRRDAAPPRPAPARSAPSRRRPRRAPLGGQGDERGAGILGSAP